MTNVWQELFAETERIIAGDADPVITYGRDLIDLPEDMEVLKTVAIKTPEMIIELRTCNPKAVPPFEWLAEITLRGAEYKHYLLRPDQTVVETYGKNVSDVSDESASELLAQLKAI